MPMAIRVLYRSGKNNIKLRNAILLKTTAEPSHVYRKARYNAPFDPGQGRTFLS